MAYGTVISYEYEEETADKLPNGKIEKHIEQKKIELVFNDLTPIKYMNYVGRDMYDDMIKITKKTQQVANAQSQAVLQKAQSVAVDKELTISDFTEEDFKALENLNYTEYIEFYTNIFAAMVATREYHKDLDFLDIIVGLPTSLMISDQEFMKRVSNLLSFGLKKKTATVYRRTAIN